MSDRARRGPIRAIIDFVSQIVSEMKLVVYPSKNEVITYTIVVIVFCMVMMGLITGFDFGIGYGVTKLFG